MTSGSARPVVTMADVAERAGVSRALVSIVFRGVPGASPENRERVMRAAAELDYHPDQRARLLGSKSSRTVGVLFGLHREFHGELVEAMYRSVEGSGYDLALGAWAPSRDERRAVRSLVEQRCEALVLLGPTLSSAEIHDLAARVPVVVLARALRSREVDVVRTDDFAGGRLAVEHLAGLGHRVIAHVDGQRAPGAAERRRGYRTAMQELGLEGGMRIVPGGLAEEHGEQAAAAVLAGGKVTGVTVFNDRCAAGLLSQARCPGRAGPGGPVPRRVRRQPSRGTVERCADHRRPGHEHPGRPGRGARAESCGRPGPQDDGGRRTPDARGPRDDGAVCRPGLDE